MVDSFAENLAAVARIGTLPALLDIAHEISGARLSAVARVTASRWMACALRDDIGFGLRPGDELALEETACLQALLRRGPVTVDDSKAAHGFRSLISVPIERPGGDLFGTLCAFDPAPRRFCDPRTIARFSALAASIGAQLVGGDDARVLSREQFIGTLGHDLRNPLTALLGGIEMLRRGPLEARPAQWAEMAMQSGQRMAEILDLVMDFSQSRLAGGLMVERALRDDVEPALQHLLARLSARHPDRQLVTYFAIGAMHCDTRRLLQLAAILIGNAIKHGAPDQPVEIRAATDAGEFVLTVRNAGPPIESSLLDRIFEPFASVDPHARREGLGLGLYLARQIALAHGGALTAESDPEATRFTFRMPSFPQDAAAQPPRAGIAGPGPSAGTTA